MSNKFASWGLPAWVKCMLKKACESYWTVVKHQPAVHPGVIKTHSLLGYMKRSIARRSRKVIISLYLVLIRLHLEFCIQFQAPVTRNKLEQVQRTSLRWPGTGVLWGEAEGGSLDELGEGDPAAVPSTYMRAMEKIDALYWGKNKR